MSSIGTLVVLVMVVLAAGTMLLGSIVGVPGAIKEPPTPKPKPEPHPMPALVGPGHLGQISQEAFVREAERAIAARSILPGVEPDDSPGMQMKVLGGIVVSALVILVLGAYVIWEPFRETRASNYQLVEAQQRGGKLFTTYCASCHGPTGTGQIGPNLHLKEIAASPITKGLAGTTFNTSDPAELAKLHDFLVKTISTGVAGTPMPAWSNAYGGALNESQIDDLATLIVNDGWATYVHPTPQQLATTTTPAPAAPGGAAAPPGQALMVKYGCGACHTIDGVQGFTGTVGPNLSHVASVPKIPESTGNLVNNPENLQKWIFDAQSVKPGTVMPNFSAQGMTQDDAKAITAYLETLK
jgi:cytochrome c